MARPRKSGKPPTRVVTQPVAAPPPRALIPRAATAQPPDNGPLKTAQMAAVNFALMQSAPDKYLDQVMLPPGMEGSVAAFNDTLTLSAVLDASTGQYVVACSCFANTFYQASTIAAGVVTAVATTTLAGKSAVLGVSTQVAHCAFGMRVSTQGSTQTTLTYQAGVLPRRVGTTNDSNTCNTIQGVRDLLASEPYRSTVPGQSLREDNLVVLVDGLYLGLQTSAGPQLNPNVPGQCITYVLTSATAFQVLVRIYQRMGYIPTTAAAPTAETYAAPPLNTATYDIVKSESMRTSSGTASTATSLKDAAFRVAKEVAGLAGPSVLKGIGAVLRAGARAVLPGWASWILDVQHQASSIHHHSASLRSPGVVSSEDESKLADWIESYPPELRAAAAFSVLVHYELSGSLGGPTEWSAFFKRASSDTRYSR